MTLEEKIGQMTQRNAGAGQEDAVRAGRLGSILNEVDVGVINRGPTGRDDRPGSASLCSSAGT